MRKWLFLSSVVIFIPILMISCVPTNTPAAAPVTSPITELQNWRTGMDTWKATVADPAIAKANAAAAAANTAPLQAAIDTQKAANIQLQTDLTALTKRVTDSEAKITAMATLTPSSGISTGGQSGQIPGFTPGTPPAGTIPVSAGGGVVSQVNWVQGTSQTFSSPSGSSNNIWYIQRLINQSTAIQYVRPMITLGVSSQYGYAAQAYFAGMNINVSSSQGSVQGVYTPPTIWAANLASYAVPPAGTPLSSISATPPVQPTGTTYSFNPPLTTPLTFSLAPGLGQVSNSVLIMPISGLGNNLGEFYISPGGYVDVTVMLQTIYTSTAVMWNVSASYSSHT
jgi:hypothetical protein